MKWLGLIIAIIIGSCLSKILCTGQKQAEANGKPRCNLIHIVFWVVWSFTFLLYLCILGLLVWVGIHAGMEGDAIRAVKMLVISLLLAPCIYQLFIHPVIKKAKNKR